VQTRVKVDSGYCRVALQISSNPHNEGSLTDLTIIMGVANDIRGESLVTQPAGGVWNASKRSVIWCVSELGDGEKFQLQARFEMDEDNAYAKGDQETPKFPVLVRCQCMYAQLSDVEVAVRDIPELYPTDVAMKVARRFRLSHQERS
jgi:Muniscin C-terminal mu homology domain